MNVAVSLGELAKGCDVVVSALPNDVVLTAVVEQVLEDFKKGSVHV